MPRIKTIERNGGSTVCEFADGHGIVLDGVNTVPELRDWARSFIRSNDQDWLRKFALARAILKHLKPGGKFADLKAAENVNITIDPDEITMFVEDTA